MTVPRFNSTKRVCVCTSQAKKHENELKKRQLWMSNFTSKTYGFLFKHHTVLWPFWIIYDV